MLTFPLSTARTDGRNFLLLSFQMLFRFIFHQTYFLWLSVSVMPCEDTLKCTMVGVDGEVAASVSDMALETA